MPPRWLIWGLAAYGFRFVFSQNIGAAVEAFYVEHLRWQWIYWQNVAAAAPMLLLARFGMPLQPINWEGLRRGDWSGVILVSSGLALLYAGLDQGNRLDWLNSGTVVGLLLAGGILLAAFVVNELWAKPSLIRFPVLRERNILLAMTVLAAYSCGIISTSYLLPDYLTRVQGLRALEVGDVLLWIALPQIVIVPLAAQLVRVVDARLVLGLGLTLMAAGNWLDTGLTHDWIRDDFLASQIIDAIGLAFTIVALVCFAVANIRPEAAATVGAIIQVTRLMGAELANAGMQTFVRVKEQIYSNLLGLHVQAGGRLTDDFIARLAGRFAGHTADLRGATGQAVGTLASAVRREAYVLAYIDGFWIVACALALGLCALFFTRPPPPNPLTPPVAR